MFDFLWMPMFLNIFLFLFYFYLIRESVSKIVIINNYKIKKKIKFFKNNFYNDYYNLIKFIYKFTIYIYLLFFFNNSYSFYYSNNFYFFNFHIYNYIWIYYILLNIIIIICLKLLFNYIKNNINKSFEFLLSIIMFINCLFYYLLVNNLIVLIFIFEFQSLIFIYLLATNFTLTLNQPNLNILKNNNYSIQPIWYFNSLLYQFWVSFIGALLLIYSSLNLFKLTSFNDWLNLESYLYMYYYTLKYKSFFQFFFI